MSDEFKPSTLGDHPDTTILRDAPARAGIGSSKRSGADLQQPTQQGKRRRAMISAQLCVRGATVGCNGPDAISVTVEVSHNGFLFL
jgi:hypothetical protein